MPIKSKFSTKKYPVFDYIQATDAFVEKLERIEEHIRAHKNHTEWRSNAAEVRKAIKMYAKVKKEAYPTEQRRLMKAFFVYVGEHILGWWC